MADMGIKAKLSAMRARKRAECDVRKAALAARPASAVPARLMSPGMTDRDSRSPSQMSTVPPVEAQEILEDDLRPERYETLLPGLEPSVNGEHRVNGGPNSNLDVHDAPDDESVNQHLVSLDFGGMQRDQYKSTFNGRKDMIDEFTSKVYPINSELAQEARDLVQELHHTVMHPDLTNSGTFTQSSVEAATQADWDVNCSVKFRFLKHLLETARDSNLHLALLVTPGRFAGILQNFLQGIEIMYNVVDGENNVINSSSTATILWSTVEGGVEILSLDMIVVLDGNMPTQTVTRAQRMLSRDQILLPTINIVIPRSIEHVERCLPSTMSEAERLHVLVSTITFERTAAGWQHGGTEDLRKKASDIICWILNPAESDWPFYGLPEIQLLEPLYSQSTSENEDDGLQTDGTQVNGDRVNSVKRPLLDVDLPVAKKARVEPFPLTINPSEMHLPQSDMDSMHLSHAPSHVTDSIAASQHATAIQALKDEFARKERESEAAVHSAQIQVQQHAKSMESLQFEFEEQRAKLIKVEAERNQAVQREMRQQERVLTLQAKNTSYRDEIAQLKKQLDDARLTMQDHTIPDRAELEKMRLELDTAKSDREKEASRVKALDSQVDYLRDNYQTASNQATTLAAANAAHEKLIKELEIKASGEQAKLRGMSLDSHSKKLQADNEKLTATLKGREEALSRMNEELIKLREASRGRVGTRASSVPRTPRSGTPMLDRNPGSRQGSPASARPRHPLSKG